MHRATLRFTLLAWLLVRVLWPTNAAAAPSLTIALQPLGVVSTGVLRAVEERVEEVYDAHVMVLPARPLPRSAYYAARSRYRGERLLEWLDAQRPAGVTKILGVMSADLSVTKGQVYDWGVMGVAGLSTPAGVISVHRLGARGATEDLVEARARQVAVHELGHAFGLPHCRSPHCIMNDAEGGIRAVDESSGQFCEACRQRLRGLLRS